MVAYPCVHIRTRLRTRKHDDIKLLSVREMMKTIVKKEYSRTRIWRKISKRRAFVKIVTSFKSLHDHEATLSRKANQLQSVQKQIGK